MENNKADLIESKKPPKTEMKEWMFQEQVKLLYQNQAQSWVISILASGIIAYLSFESDDALIGVLWWVVFVAITLGRIWNTRQFCDVFAKGESINFKHWFSRFFALTLLAGAGWGVGGFVVGSSLDHLSQVYIFIVLIGVGAAAIPLLGVMQSVMLSFQAISTVPYIIYISIQLDERGGMLLFMFALYMVAVVSSIRRMNKNFGECMTLQFEKTQMVDALSESNQKLQYTNEKLETLSLEDALTELHNRRYFEMQLEVEWRREAREQKILTLMVIDIDFFKLYNDTYGHAEGDVCLKNVAQALRSCIHRPSDIIARIGGEEFVVMLPGIDENGASVLAKQMQDQLELTALTHASSPLGENLTVSIGIASVVPGNNATALGLFKAADKALYKAKANGRNRFVIGEMELT